MSQIIEKSRAKKSWEAEKYLGLPSLLGKSCIKAFNSHIDKV